MWIGNEVETKKENMKMMTSKFYSENYFGDDAGEIILPSNPDCHAGLEAHYIECYKNSNSENVPGKLPGAIDLPSEENFNKCYAL